jgi:hypothetical protein
MDQLYFVGVFDAKRVVANAVQGSGPGPVVPDAESRSRAREFAGRLRSLFGTGLIRAGETILGPGCPNPLTEGATGRS